MSRFQILPPLSAEDYETLKADIRVRGVQVAVEYDREGRIIDGHHRVMACKELGITKWPRKVRDYADDSERRTQARRLNLARRHLDREAKRALIAAELKESPERSDRMIAADLGVDHKTVGSVRTEAQSTGEIPQLGKTKGRDGKQRARSMNLREPKAPAVADHSSPSDDDELLRAALHDLCDLWVHFSPHQRNDLLTRLRDLAENLTRDYKKMQEVDRRLAASPNTIGPFQSRELAERQIYFALGDGDGTRGLELANRLGQSRIEGWIDIAIAGTLRHEVIQDALKGLGGVAA